MDSISDSNDIEPTNAPLPQETSNPQSHEASSPQPPTSFKYRSKAREIAMQFLYQMDLLGRDIIKDFPKFLLHRMAAEDIKQIAEVERTAMVQYAQKLIDACFGAWKDLDECISQATPNWSLPRMTTVDRNILRIATYELLYQPEIPAPIILNDAIELGKQFSTADSGRFINGVLNKIWKTKRPQ